MIYLFLPLIVDTNLKVNSFPFFLSRLFCYGGLLRISWKIHGQDSNNLWICNLWNFVSLITVFLQNGRWFENIVDRFWHVAETWGALWQGRASEAVGRGRGLHETRVGVSPDEWHNVQVTAGKSPVLPISVRRSPGSETGPSVVDCDRSGAPRQPRGLWRAGVNTLPRAWRTTSSEHFDDRKLLLIQ